jgi:hypothetical protein
VIYTKCKNFYHRITWQHPSKLSKCHLLNRFTFRNCQKEPVENSVIQYTKQKTPAIKEQRQDPAFAKPWRQKIISSQIRQLKDYLLDDRLLLLLVRLPPLDDRAALLLAPEELR